MLFTTLYMRYEPFFQFILRLVGITVFVSHSTLLYSVGWSMVAEERRYSTTHWIPVLGFALAAAVSTANCKLSSASPALVFSLRFVLLAVIVYIQPIIAQKCNCY